MIKKIVEKLEAAKVCNVHDFVQSLLLMNQLQTEELCPSVVFDSLQ